MGYSLEIIASGDSAGGTKPLQWILNSALKIGVKSFRERCTDSRDACFIRPFLCPQAVD